MDEIKSNIPPKAMPTKRKGSAINHTIGYRINAKMANGQHKTNNNSQRMNPAKTTPI